MDCTLHSDDGQTHLLHGNDWLGEAIGINCQDHTQLVVIWTETETKRPTRYVYNDHKSEYRNSKTSRHAGKEDLGREDEVFIANHNCYESTQCSFTIQYTSDRYHFCS